MRMLPSTVLLLFYTPHILRAGRSMVEDLRTSLELCWSESDKQAGGMFSVCYSKECCIVAPCCRR